LAVEPDAPWRRPMRTEKQARKGKRPPKWALVWLDLQSDCHIDTGSTSVFKRPFLPDRHFKLS
jgi:hypothetical protein